MSMMKAVQKSFSVGEIIPILVGPMENFRLSNPPNASPEIIPTARAARAAGSFLLSSSARTIRKTATPRIMFRLYSANLPATPERKRFFWTISSIPFLRKTRPRESWIPLTTGCVKILARAFTVPVMDSRRRITPK
jgi:hypothetical protein